jgi:sulfate transport system permease protein
VLGATALAVVMLALSFILLLAVNAAAMVGGQPPHGTHEPLEVAAAAATGSAA